MDLGDVPGGPDADVSWFDKLVLLVLLVVGALSFHQCLYSMRQAQIKRAEQQHQIRPDPQPLVPCEHRPQETQP